MTIPKQERNQKGKGSWRTRLQELAVPLLLVGAFLALRLPGLGRGITIDEVYWLNRSALFTQALQSGEWGDTVLSGHPGVTTMWAGSLGILTQVGDLQKLNIGPISDFNLRHALWQHGINPVQVLAAGRLFAVLFNAAAFVLSWPYARRLFGRWAAALGLGLLALEPFVVGHQRLLHQDGLMTSFCLLSLLAFAGFLQAGRRRDVAISGAAAGLAWLTKSPTLALVPVVLVLAWLAWRAGSLGKRELLSGLGIWLGTAALAFTLLWPAMLAQPLAALQSTLGYALGSAGGEFSGPIFFNGIIYPSGDLGWTSLYFYPESFAWRSSPWVLLGLLGALVNWIFGKRGEKKVSNLGIAALLLFALIFTVGMSIAEKKFDRYLLPAQGALMFVAGWGWWQWLERWAAAGAGRRWAPLAAVVLLSVGFAGSARLFPYYLSYYDGWLGGPQKAQEAMMIGWGEGLDQAAAYLKAEGANGEAVASWYSNLFNLFFEQDAGDIPIAIELPQATLEDLYSREYLVIYVHQWQRGTPQQLLDALEGREPAYRVWINGLEYVRVYQMRE